MSVTRRSIIFILITFAVSWTVAILARQSGMTGIGRDSVPGYFVRAR
jgi:hypothetical protein